MADNLLTYYENRLAELNFDPEYMLRAAPFIREYCEINEDKVVDNDFPMVFKTNGKRQELYKKYMVEVEGHQPDINEFIKVRSEDEPCKKCGGDVLMCETSAALICTKCGLCETYLGCELTYKEEQSIEKNIVYSYKRENHFNEWMSQFQGTESTTIPPQVIEQLRYELKKQRVKKLSDITHTKVRALLKKLKFNKYYEHVPYISAILNGVTPPRMTQALEEKLRLMFNKIQAPFELHCPAERKNFISYSYVLYKFCELLGKDEFLPCFPLLKSKEKLRQQDAIWKNITATLRWEYIPTA